MIKSHGLQSHRWILNEQFLKIQYHTYSANLFFKKGPTRPLLFLFGLFKQTLQFLQQLYVKKCPSSIRCRDSNPRP